MNYMKCVFSLLSVAALLLAAACNPNVVNSSANDARRAAVANLAGGPNFKNAIPAIIEKCAGCHTEYFDYDEAAYANASQVVFGDLTASKLYYRLSNSSQGPGPKNMPQGGGAALTDAEIDALETWISGSFGG